MTKMVYNVYDYENLVSTELMLSHAVTVAEALVWQDTDPRGITRTIRDASGKLVAAITSRRIIGTFTRQIWGGHKGKDSENVGDDAFDATDFVLNMQYEHVLELEDNRPSTDSVGTAHIEWDGPYEVEVVESLCEFFGVERLADITPEVFEFVRERFQSRKPEVHEVELTLKVRAFVNPGASIEDFIRDAEYSVASATNGVRVSSVTMTGTRIEEKPDARA